MTETIVQEQSKQDFSLENHIDFWRLNNVKHQNEFYKPLDLSKTLLPSRTQYQHALQAIEAKKTGKFHLGSYPLYHAMFTSLCLNKDNPDYKKEIEKIRLFLQRSMLNYWLTSLTRIRHNPKEIDTIIHDYKQGDQYEANIDFIGEDGLIIQEDVRAEEPLRSLLQTNQSVKEINSVYQWINNTDAYIWRVNKKPRSIDERVAWFRAGSDRVGLGCAGDPRLSYSGLGVRYAEGAQKFFMPSLDKVTLSDEIFSSTKRFVQEPLQEEYRETLENICKKYK